MKTKSKVLLLSICAVLIIGASVFASLAYLTDTKKVTNTFTVGKVNILLEETLVDEYGRPVDEEGNPLYQTDEANNPILDDDGNYIPLEGQDGFATTTTGNKYKLIPGVTSPKDPTLTILKGSEESYVRMAVMVLADKYRALEEHFSGLDLTTVFSGYDADKWNFIDEGEGTSSFAPFYLYEFRYHTTVTALSNNQELEPLFTGIKVPEEFTSDDLALMEGLDLRIVGQAIQAIGFDNDNDAWTAFNIQASS